MVIVLEAQAAVTPAGKPVAVPIPVAPVVVIVISVKAVLIHKLGVLDAVPAVFAEQAGLNAINSAPLGSFSLLDNSPNPVPVLPAGVLLPQAFRLSVRKMQPGSQKHVHNTVYWEQCHPPVSHLHTSHHFCHREALP